MCLGFIINYIRCNIKHLKGVQELLGKLKQLNNHAANFQRIYTKGYVAVTNTDSLLRLYPT